MYDSCMHEITSTSVSSKEIPPGSLTVMLESITPYEPSSKQHVEITQVITIYDSL